MKKFTGQPEPQAEGKIAVETFQQERWHLPISFRAEGPPLSGRARVFHLSTGPAPSREIQLSALVTAVLQKLAA